MGWQRPSQVSTGSAHGGGRPGARRPATGAFLLWFGPAVLALALLGRPADARAQSQEDEGTWAGDETDALAEEPPPPPEGDESEADAYSQGYEAGRRDALADQTAGPAMADFHSSLDQSGEWVQTQEYGAVWRPTAVESSWRPYTSGHWDWTRYGWTWVGDEPWGWAVYHYGRWVVLPTGWAWIPGRVWAPAWVAWRWGGGWAGWCPLGPRGQVFWSDAAWWIFVEQHRFLEPVRRYAAPVERFGELHPRARPFRHTRSLLIGPGRRAVATATGRSVEPVRVDTVGHPSMATNGAHVTGGVIHVFAPQSRPLPSSGVGRAAERQRGSPSWIPRPNWSNRQGGGVVGGTVDTRTPSGATTGPAGGGVPVHGTPIVPGGKPVHFGGVPSFHPGGQGQGGQGQGGQGGHPSGPPPHAGGPSEGGGRPHATPPGKPPKPPDEPHPGGKPKAKEN